MSCNSENKSCKQYGGLGRAKGVIPVVGLAGGIGSGKSLVAHELAQMGCAVIDVDRLAKELRDRPETLEEISRSLGEGVFGTDGRIDDKSLAEHVFGANTGSGNGSPLARLNGIVHPLVVRRCRELIEEYRGKKDVPAIVLDAALLFETELNNCCEAVIFVQAEPGLRSRRVQKDRGWSEKQWQQREKSQILLDKKTDMSDYIVANNSSKTDLRCHIQRLFPRILGKISDVQRKARVSKGVGEASDGGGRQLGK